MLINNLNQVCVLLSIACFWPLVKCNNLNTPPTMWLDRNWKIPETEPVGTVITRVHGSDAENDVLEYGLEPSQDYGQSGAATRRRNNALPFRIDNTTGVVFLNESLKGRAGENIFLYVTVDDGDLIAKTEVWVNVLNQSIANGYGKTRGPPPPPFLTGFNARPPAILNNPPPHLSPSIPSNPVYTNQQQPHFQQKTYPSVTAATTKKPNAVRLVPLNETYVRGVQNVPRTTTTAAAKDYDDEDGENNQLKNEIKDQHHRPEIVDRPVKSDPDLAVTLVPILSVCVVFLVVGGVALIFRKKICLGRTKTGKVENMRKESSGATIDSDSDFALRQWTGPRAFNNRYEPWDRDNGRQSISCRSSEAAQRTGTASDQWEFPRHRLKFFNVLGEGAFGQVWRCDAQDIDGRDGITVVAVKTLKENATDKERSDLLQELQVMKMLEPHPNVVRLLGCCTDKEPVFVIMEYVTNGKLQSFLRNSRAERHYDNMHGQSGTLTSRDLTSFCYQVAKGMEYLSANGIIHRDLAARNVLIAEDHTCKVADFGFARDVIASYVYERKSEGRLPIRWMAPESLYDNVFSVKSDVWSFGVLIWEVVTLGSTPYPGLSAAEVMRKVRDGHRLDKPEHCRRELYNIMYYCWNKDQKQRPTFGECVELLEKLLMTETDYIELERFPDHSYYNMMSMSGEKL